LLLELIGEYEVKIEQQLVKVNQYDELNVMKLERIDELERLKREREVVEMSVKDEI
jgi:adenylosuccinate synthase